MNDATSSRCTAARRRCWSACRTSAPRIPDDAAARATSPRALARRGHRLAPRRGSTPSCASSARACSCRAISRYVIDLNRPPENAPMYPGANNTELCPTRFFTGEPLYRDGRAPRRGRDRARAASTTGGRTTTRSRAELARLQAAHGHAVLFDGHSIKSRAAVAVRRPAARPEPRHRRRRELRAGAARRAGWRARGADAASAHVIDGRFKGGYITRHYGRPAQRRARGAARDVLALLHGRERRPTRCDAGARRRACSRCCARLVADDARLAAAMAADGAATPRCCGRRAPGCRRRLARAACCCASAATAAGPRSTPGVADAAGRRAACSPARCCPAWSTRTATPSSAPSPAWPSGATARERRLLVVARPHVRASRCASRPTQLRAVAAQLYVELLRGGYTQVCEFHYLQHDADGQPLRRPARRCRGRWPTPPPTPASA